VVELRLPTADRRLLPYRLGTPRAFQRPRGPLRSRVVYAAAHVVCDPLADADPTGPAHLDWEATLAFRRHLWSYGLHVAEAMDTAQRGMGLDWETSRELMRRSAAEARACGGVIACGAGTDQLGPGSAVTLADVIAAYEEQCAFVEGLGARVVLMASRALVRCARGPEDYARVYERILTQVSRPVIIHWLGPMFDAQLAGYWGSDDLDQAAEVCLAIVRAHADKVDGIKLSLLHAEREEALRRRLPPGVRLYTGDDFHYPRLLAGDDHGHSDALLGIFDGIAPAAAEAIQALDRGESDQFRAVLEPTLPLARHIFRHPTHYYKTGLTFLAYLNGHQDHFRMVGGLESARSVVHLAQIVILADQAGLLADPERAAERTRRVLALAGIV
jgi:hypothetical protein